jgi:hypothetical protein
MSIKYFFDVPVYRINEEQYQKEWGNSPGNRTLQKNKTLYEHEPALGMAAHVALKDQFGGCWQYNQIVGYIKLHTSGLQIRGEFYFTSKPKKSYLNTLHINLLTKLIYLPR